MRSVVYTTAAGGGRRGVVLLLSLAACVHEAPPPGAPAGGIERAVFPVLVSARTPRWLGAPREPARACSGVYVGPRTFATSESAFAPDQGAILADAGALSVYDGDHPLTVEYIAFPAEAPGLVLVRTRERAEPLALRPDRPSEGEPLQRVGFSFRSAPRRVRPIAEWNIGGAVALDAETRVEGLLPVATQAPPGACGAPLLDSRGRVAGIVLRGGPALAHAADAPSVARALERFDN